MSEQPNNDKTLVMSLKNHLPATAGRGLAKAPEAKGLAIAENMGLAGVALGLNPIVEAAGSLLAVLAELKLPDIYCDSDKLRRKLFTQIKEFEHTAKLKGVPAMNVLIARYLVCAVLDEAVLYLPSSEQSDWASQSLLSTFHEDAGGGEKFFSIMERMSQDPVMNIDVLELIYICLALGFEGKYRVMDGGTEQLRMLRESLYQRIQLQRKREKQPLADHIAKTDRLKPVTLGIPFRQVIGATAGLLLVIYIGFLVASYVADNATAHTIKALVTQTQTTHLAQDDKTS